VLTSANDGQHGFGSLHYAGLAVDVRTHHVTANDIEPLADTIREALGPQFDVVLEDTHIHVEFQPK
jgi:UDP-N-acetylenolpyruvoylglucosamine reductase